MIENSFEVHNASDSQNILLQYVYQIIKGGLSGIDDLLQTVLHPIDNLIYPVTMLAYDSYIIAAMHVDTADPELLEVQRYLTANKQFYETSVQRMQALVDGFKQAGMDFMQACGPERVGTITHITISVLTPGFLIKNFSRIRQTVANFPGADLLIERPKFHNLIAGDVSPLPPSLHYLTAEDILSRPGTHIYNFVILEDETLLMMSKAIETRILNVQGRYVMRELHHHELAQLQRVSGAGEFYVIDGVLDTINSLSGHYQPCDILFKPSLKPFVENKFVQMGFENAHGKYIASFPGEMLPPPPSVWGTWPVATVVIGDHLTITARSSIDIGYDALLTVREDIADAGLKVKEALSISHQIIRDAFSAVTENLTRVDLLFSSAHASENKEAPTESSSSTSSEYIGVLFGPNATQPQLSYLYRGDARAPQSIFSGGFTARGSNTDLFMHVNLPSHCDSQSAYISTSTSRKIASGFPGGLEAHGFVYELNPQKNAIDVGKALSAEMSGTMSAKDKTHYHAEKEMAVPEKIKAHHIKGAWPVELTEVNGKYQYRIQETFIPNPLYVAPGSRILQAAKIAGRISMVTGVALDGMSLYQTYQTSKQSGNFDPVFNEGARIIGGWAGAYALGTASGELMATLCLPCGPIASAVCGVTGGIAGSVLGYLGGGELLKNAQQNKSIHLGLQNDLIYSDPDQAAVVGEKISQGLNIAKDAFAKLSQSLGKTFPSMKAEIDANLNKKIRNQRQKEQLEAQEERYMIQKSEASHRAITNEALERLAYQTGNPSTASYNIPHEHSVFNVLQEIDDQLKDVQSQLLGTTFPGVSQPVGITQLSSMRVTLNQTLQAPIASIVQTLLNPGPTANQFIWNTSVTQPLKPDPSLPAITVNHRPLSSSHPFPPFIQPLCMSFSNGIGNWSSVQSSYSSSLFSNQNNSYNSILKFFYIDKSIMQQLCILMKQ